MFNPLSLKIYQVCKRRSTFELSQIFSSFKRGPRGWSRLTISADMYNYQGKILFLNVSVQFFFIINEAKTKVLYTDYTRDSFFTFCGKCWTRWSKLFLAKEPEMKSGWRRFLFWALSLPRSQAYMPRAHPTGAYPLKCSLLVQQFDLQILPPRPVGMYAFFKCLIVLNGHSNIH